MRDENRLMDQELAERAELERRISEAGWHIVRDEQVTEGFLVEFRQGSPAEFDPEAASWTSQGSDRNDAYRRFLDALAAGQPPRET